MVVYIKQNDQKSSSNCHNSCPDYGTKKQKLSHFVLKAIYEQEKANLNSKTKISFIECTGSIFLPLWDSLRTWNCNYIKNEGCFRIVSYPSALVYGEEWWKYSLLYIIHQNKSRTGINWFQVEQSAHISLKVARASTKGLWKSIRIDSFRRKKWNKTKESNFLQGAIPKILSSILPRNGSETTLAIFYNKSM